MYEKHSIPALRVFDVAYRVPTYSWCYVHAGRQINALCSATNNVCQIQIIFSILLMTLTIQLGGTFRAALEPPGCYYKIAVPLVLKHCLLADLFYNFHLLFEGVHFLPKVHTNFYHFEFEKSAQDSKVLTLILNLSPWHIFVEIYLEA